MTRRQATVFGEVAELYHRHRPDYPGAMFDWLVDLTALPSPALVIDVGCGTGKSSSFFVARGDRVIGVEPDPAMAAVARRTAVGPGRLDIAPLALQDWAGPDRPADLAVSGQAWHWADPATRFDDVADKLSPTGWLCVFWNRPEPVEHPFAEEVTAAYRRHAPELATGTTAIRFPGSKAAVAAPTPSAEFDQSGRFGPVERFEVTWDREIDAEEHCANLRTQSDHRLLDQAALEGLLTEINEAILGVGGSYQQPYTTHAYAAVVLT